METRTEPTPRAALAPAFMLSPAMPVCLLHFSPAQMQVSIFAGPIPSVVQSPAVVSDASAHENVGHWPK